MLSQTIFQLNRSKITAIAVDMGTPLINKFLDGVAGKTRDSPRLLSAPAPLRELVLEDLAVSAEAQEVLDQLALLAVHARMAAAAAVAAA